MTEKLHTIFLHADLPTATQQKSKKMPSGSTVGLRRLRKFFNRLQHFNFERYREEAANQDQVTVVDDRFLAETGLTDMLFSICSRREPLAEISKCQMTFLTLTKALKKTKSIDLNKAKSPSGLTLPSYTTAFLREETVFLLCRLSNLI